MLFLNNEDNADKPYGPGNRRRHPI
jgi:hypothetical protein